jgi:type IV pilus assembly protein PilB
MNRKHHGTHPASTAPNPSSDSAVLIARRSDDLWKEKEVEAGVEILYVEDRPELRELVAHIFAPYDCNLIEASNSGKALTAASVGAPKLIILDYELPDFSGFELIGRIRQMEALVSTPIIMLSGSPRAFMLGESLEHEISALLRKPISSEALIETVERCLGGRMRKRKPTEAAPERPAAPSETAGFQSLLDSSAHEASRGYTFESDKPTLDTHETVMQDAAPIIKMVNAILGLAVEKKASDIHLEPQENGVRVRFRVDGCMVPQLTVPLAMSPAIVARLKVMASLNIAERRMPQDGRFRLNLPDGRPLDIRLSTLPSRHGEKIVMRLLGLSRITPDLTCLRMAARDLKCVREALANPSGLILVTGPTGSGKTTTLYTMLAALNTPERNIVTVEDPIECEMAGITQVAVRPEIGYTFEKALRAFLRQDPDVILLGEIRDAETAEIAMKAAVTGHLVLSTLHTNDAVSTLSRLVNMGVPPYMVASSIRLIVAQRLVRLLCPYCKISGAPNDEAKRLLMGHELTRLPVVGVAAGCTRCDGTGYKGRAPVMEVLPVRGEHMRELISRESTADRIQTLAVKEGLRPLRQAALELVEAGLTSLPEALKVAVSD